MTDTIEFLPNTLKQFQYYKMLGEKAIDQVNAEALHWQYNAESNSIAIIINHLWGNMMSRFTNFLTEDGEKKWRNREREFEVTSESKEALMQKWNEGWSCVLNAVGSLKESDLSREVYIRNVGHTALEAINRQLAHYSYHIGQLVYISRMQTGSDWQSLSIPRGESDAYNAKKFAKEPGKGHFTDEFLEK
ncbi:MAG: DUF1572 family protein [Saprospiraceae bacterium]|nr:DUF1572 family protein [Saprospiraceae bacterium]